jgi:DDE superfamily endonuclease
VQEQKNSNPQPSTVQKAATKALSQVRIFIENATSDMKRYNILVYGFRNCKAAFEDDVIVVCVGLWNFVLSY